MYSMITNVYQNALLVNILIQVTSVKSVLLSVFFVRLHRNAQNA